jgi:hypothetical protein
VRRDLQQNHRQSDRHWLRFSATQRAYVGFLFRYCPNPYIRSGIHFVNRIGYLISTVPVPEGTDIEVRIPMENADDGETGESEA